MDAKLVYAAAIKANSSSLILLAHCHPSGNLLPSEQDKQSTRRIKETGKVLDIPALDHLILTAEGYYFFADEGEL